MIKYHINRCGLAIFIAPLVVVNVYGQEKVGTLTAYYAKVATDGYKAGDLIVDTNDPMNRIVPYSKTHWKYEGDNTGEYYSSKIAKTKVTVRTWDMNELPVSMVKNGATFIAKSGRKARVFWANNSGRQYCNWDGNEDWRATERYKGGCFVLSVWIKSSGDSNWLFEDPLYEECGNIRLYQKNRFGDDGCRKRPGRIGLIEEEWYNPENWPQEKSAYDNTGRLLCNQFVVDGIADYISIAYIASENALYINGELYYKQ